MVRQGNPIFAKSVKQAANSHWREILLASGVTLPSGKRHSACPVCGGKDRFRFDDKDGNGTWYCNQCEPHSGDGFNLLMNVTGKSFAEVLDMVAAYLGMERSTPIDHQELARMKAKAEAQQLHHQQTKAVAAQQAAELAELMLGESVDTAAESVPYLASKGFKGFNVLTLSRDYQHTANSKQYTYPKDSLLVWAGSAQGKITSAEIINSSGKFALAGGVKKGSFAIVEPLNENGQPNQETRFAIAEGYATALSVRALLGGNVLVLAGLSKVGLLDAAKVMRHDFPTVEILICGDNGAEVEAEAAADAVGGLVAFPPEGYGDWDDYRQAVERGEVAA